MVRLLHLVIIWNTLFKYGFSVFISYFAFENISVDLIVALISCFLMLQTCKYMDSISNLWVLFIFVENNISMQWVLCSFFLCDNITDICPRIFNVSFLDGLQTSNFAACNFSRTFFQSWPPDLRWPSITGNCPPKCGNVMRKASSWKTKPINLPFNQVLTVLFLNFVC